MTSSILWLFLAILIGVYSQTCLNGGSSNGTDCICQSFFSGEDCSTFECINGGYLDSTNTSCVCPPGYRGLHCETVKASLAPSGSFSSSTPNSLNIINFNLHTFYWGAKTYSNIQRAFKEFVEGNSLDSINLLESTGSPFLDVLNQIGFSKVDYTFTKNISLGDFELADHVDTGLYWSYQLDVYEKIIQVIKGASLSNSAITIITQHLPSAKDQELAQKMILAFGIRINVLWISDKTYNNCTDSQIADFKSFSENTGGLFVQLKAEENDTTTYTLVRTVLQTHLNPQYLQMQDIKSCENATTINFVNDASNTQPVYVVLRGDNVATDALSLRGCGNGYAISYDSQLTVFTFYNPQCSKFTITSSNACSAFVFTNYPKTDPSNVQVFLNFIEDKTIDASRYAIIENVPFFASIHVESINGVDTQINAINSASPLGVENRRISAFEWVSKNPVQCSSDSSQFLQLNITVNSTITIIRNVRINCLAKVVPTTIAPTTTTLATTVALTTSADLTTPQSSISSTEVSSTIQYTTPVASTTAAVDSTTAVTSTTAVASTTDSATTPAQDICSTPQITTSPSFFFAYSTELDSHVYGISKNYILPYIPPSMSSDQKLSSVRLECTDSEIHDENDKTSFSVDLAKYSTNLALRTDEPDASNVIEVVRKYLTDNTIENAVIVALLTRLPKTSFTSEEHATLVNKNIKIFTILSINDLSAQVKLGRTASELNKISALTNSHFVIANASTLVEYSDYSKIVNKFMQFGYSKDLIYTRNIVQGSGTEIGTFNVSKDANLTITLSFAVPNDQLPNVPSQLRIGLRDETETMTSVDLIGSQTYTSSNFYTADIVVSSGLKKVILLSTSPYETLLRIWIDKSVDQNAYFVDLNGKITSPDNRDGAALRFSTGIVKQECRKGTSIVINDCSGNIGTKFDSNQFASPDVNGTYSFVPYFCDSTTSSRCVSGAENKFDVQIITDGLSITRSFLCADSSVEIDSNCQSKDAYGNYQCSGVAPFKRGPTGKLTDCSRHGTLFYNASANNDIYSSHYQCKCDSQSFTGESCEIAKCQNPNNDGLSIDNSYRTYSVVIGIDHVSYELRSAAKQAIPYFGLGSSVSTIWKYQLFVQCLDGQLENLYSGSSFDAFTTTFKSPSLTIKCSESPNNKIDLSTVYSNVVTGIGRNVRGAIVYYTSLPASLNVSLPNFLTSAQTYQQQLFVVTADDDLEHITQLDSSISQAAMSTGGFLIQTYIDPDTGNLAFGKNDKIISDIVSNPTSIGYIAQNYPATSGFDITLESTTSIAYLITWNRGGTVLRNNAEQSTDVCDQVDDTMTKCKITGSIKNTITFASQSKNYSAIVYVINEVSPKVQLISTTSQDIADALSTEKSSTNILSIYVPDDNYSIVANDNVGGSTRIAQRSDCTFGYTSYSVFADSKYQQGANFALISLQKSGGSKLTRYFPIITSSDITCQNGGTPNSASSSCICSQGFTGPDCSLVDCSSSLFSAKPNSWSDVCVCDSLYDETCATYLR